MQCGKVESRETLSGQAENKRWCLSLKKTFTSAGGLQLRQIPTMSPGAYPLSFLGGSVLIGGGSERQTKFLCD